jgi:aryl-alcohol dehydrogenase-like predicted oxidoreductase
MQKRPLGRSGIAVAPIAFGGNVFGWTVDETQSMALLDRFVEHGFNAIDTADTYSSWVEGNQGGESETILGKWLQRRGRRDDVVIMTKVGMWSQRKGLSAANIVTALEESLRRLQTDYVDVYFAHIDDEATPLDETLAAFSRLVQAGKVRALGASNFSAARLQAALDVAARESMPRYEVLQPLYSLYDRSPFESDLAALAQRNDVGVLPYFPLAAGFLAGKYRSEADIVGSKRERMLGKYCNPRGFGMVACLHELAAQTGSTPARLAMAWLVNRPAVTAPIVSATSLAQLEDVLASAELTLSLDAQQALETASA